MSDAESLTDAASAAPESASAEQLTIQQPVPAQQARSFVHESQAIESSEVPVGPHEVGGQTLSRFLVFHVFSAFFGWLANRIYADVEPNVRFGRMRREHRKLFWTCVTLDLIVLVGATAILMVVATAILTHGVMR